MKLYTILVYFLAFWVVAGSLILMYYQNIDGVFINPPSTFFVDTMNLQTDKKDYHTGDIVSIFVSVCKNRNYSSKTTWRLLNATVITFPDKGTIISGKGCLKDKWVPIGAIPSYAVKGPHHLEGSAEIKVNPLKTIHRDFRSQDFNVI